MFIQSRTTVREVVIIPFVLVSDVGSNLPRAAEIIAEHLNMGWRIAAAGGAGGDGGAPHSPWANGFVILEREIPMEEKDESHDRNPHGWYESEHLD
jgi:hypothetical protein